MTAILHELSAFQTLNSQNVVQVGLAVHKGEFYKIGGGLYGKQAQLVESLAEDHAGPAEIILTKKVVSSEPHTRSNAYKFKYSKVVSDMPDQLLDYPHSFSPEFYSLLKSWHPQNTQLTKEIYNRFSATYTVIFVKITPPSRQSLLHQLSRSVITSGLVSSNISDATLVKAGGFIGILLAKSTNEALELCQNLRTVFGSYGLEITAAVTSGEVFVFTMPNGQKDLAGQPVNIASKLAEDSPFHGKILFDSSTRFEPNNSNSYTLNISHVNLTGFYV
jgi:hypothetical protein